MIALKFTDSKEISAQLLSKSFPVREILITGHYTFSVEPASDSAPAVSYGDMRPLIGSFLQLSLRQEGQTSSDSSESENTTDPAPLDLLHFPKGQIVLCASPSYQETLLSNPAFTGDPDLIRGLILTFRWNETGITALTGVSHASFTLDKSIDALWDQGIKKAFDHTSLSYKLL